MAHDGVTHDLVSLLGSGDRDFLVRNNGDQVKINTLSGKILGLYFSGSWCGPCRRFTPYLMEVYQELASKGDFEVVFISSDRDEESFSGYFSEMPWLAVPFSDLETRKGVKDLFKVRGIPHLVVIDANGKVCTDQGVVVVREYGVEGYPFTAERISFLKEQEEAAKKDQSLSSLLVSSSRDYLISSEGNKVSVSELEGKLVGLYFTLNIRKACKDFTQTLVKFYYSLKEKGEDFEIVLISLDFEEEHFKEGIAVPWLALPFKDKNCEKLARYFELETVPTLVIIGQDGKTLHPNVTELIEEHGIEAYPFSAEKIAELAEIEKAKLEAQTLESLLVSEDTDFVIETSGAKVPVSELAAYTVGLDSRIEDMMRLLDVRSSDVRVVGVHGMGGVGKTTLATAIFNRLVGQFDGQSFISNVREVSAGHKGLVSLQNKVINNLSPHVMPVTDTETGISMIKSLVYDKRVLVVLDDVDNVDQLSASVGKGQWFNEGSRIIITTRDKGLLPSYLVNYKLYEVRELQESQALQLFSYHALRRDKPTGNFLDLSKKIVSLTGGLPLALEVFGSFLFDKRRIEEWTDALHKLKKIRPQHLRDVLKISYDALDEQEKCIFLDIACLLVKMNPKREDAIDILRSCGFDGEIAIADLTAKSLIKITEDTTLWMHDQVRDMGRQIVIHENLLDPGMRSRLWEHDKIINVFKDDKGTRCIQGIVLEDLDTERKLNGPRDLTGDKISWNNFRSSLNFTSATTYLKERYKVYLQNQAEKKSRITIHSKPFGAMVNLRLLQMNYVNLEGSFKFLPSELKWLQWKGCPLKSLPSVLFLQQLAGLDLSESKVERLCSGNKNKVAEKLMFLNLSGCSSLTAIPDLSGNHALEKLILKYCVGLIKLHDSIGNLNTLVYLNLQGCINLVELPSDVSGLRKLENLNLYGCSQLKRLPKNIGSMVSLKEFVLDETSIENLPETIFHLTKLEKLSLNRCSALKGLPEEIGKLCSLKKISLNVSGLEKLPDSIGSLANLEILSLFWCSSLTTIPNSLGNLNNLMELFTYGTPIEELPLSFGSLSNLKELSVGHGHFLQALPDSIGGLKSLVVLKIDETSITDLPQEISALKTLEKLELRKCKFLRSLPESIGSVRALTSIIITAANITELPESIGMLENLTMLKLNGCKEFRKLPTSIGKLKSLHRLQMRETAVTELPESFGMLSSLMVLSMGKKPQNGRHIEEKFILPASFSNLSLLYELDARACNITGEISDDFEKLSSLETLNLSHNSFCRLPASLSGMSVLQKLVLPHCRKLKSLPPLPSSLKTVDIANCTALEHISDVSNLENLTELNLTNCAKVEDIPGLECLNSLVRLYMSGCKACLSAVKRRLAKKSYLRKIHNLSMPGSKIPDWFSQEMVTFSKQGSRPLKSVILCVVVSLNHQIPDDLREELPAVVDIQAQILILDSPTFTTTLILSGVPNTNDDQFHLCRYPIGHPLVSLLKDGYRIHVMRREPPCVKGVELKKWGIHLVYEGDDDYEGDEESLKESHQSLSEKLAKFFGSFDDEEADFTSCIEQDDCISATRDGEDEGMPMAQEIRESEQRIWLHDRH